MAAASPSTLSTIISTAILSLVTGYFLGLGSSIGILPSPFNSVSNPTFASKRGILAGRIRSDLDEEESSSSEIDDDVVLDNAPNWANGEEADRRQGLRFESGKGVSKEDRSVKLGNTSGKRKEQEKPDIIQEEEDESEGSGELVAAFEVVPMQSKRENKLESPPWESSREECKLVLVVRTDLGMTKGKIAAQAGHATLACYKTLLNQKSPILRTWERLGQAKIAVQIKSEEEMYELQAKAMSLGITAEIIADAGRTQIEAGSHTVLGIGPAPKSVVDAVTGHLKLL